MRRLDPADLLVFAPHPDDEVIGTGGVMQQALVAGRRVRVVFSTSGDGYPKAASALLGKPEASLGPADFIQLGETRRQEAIAAAHELGVPESRLVFLGYPDAALDELFERGDRGPVRSPWTLLAASPISGSPYTHADALDDFADVLRASDASEVYVTDWTDEHLDHRATNGFVHEAMNAVGSGARLRTFMVHAGGVAWPPAGPLYGTVVIDGVTQPAGVPWPPPIRVPLTPEQSARKRRALEAHASQWTIDRDYLDRLAKDEEVFWG